MTPSDTASTAPTSWAAPERRSVAQAMWRGARCRCPQCGEGRLFSGYLTVAPACEACRENYTGEEAHDLPPYVTIFIVGHVIGTLLMIAEASFDWEMWTHVFVWSAVGLVMCFALMKPVKGAVVGLQWALRMAGFGATDEAHERRHEVRLDHHDEART